MKMIRAAEAEQQSTAKNIGNDAIRNSHNEHSKVVSKFQEMASGTKKKQKRKDMT